MRALRFRIFWKIFTSFVIMRLSPSQLQTLWNLFQTWLGIDAAYLNEFSYEKYLHIYLTIIVTLSLLHCTSLTPIVRLPLTLYGKLQGKRNLMHHLKTIPEIWWLSPLGNLWLVISKSITLRLALMGPLSATKLVLLQKVLHRSMRLITKWSLLRLLISHLFVPS